MSKHTFEDTLAEVRAWSERVYRLAYTENGIEVYGFSWSSEYQYRDTSWVDGVDHASYQSAQESRLIYLLTQNQPLDYNDRALLIRLLRGEAIYE